MNWSVENGKKEEKQHYFLNTDDVVVMIKDTSTGEEVICEVIADSGNVIIKMNATKNIALGKYKAIIIG